MYGIFVIFLLLYILKVVEQTLLKDKLNTVLNIDNISDKMMYIFP
jgi:hypothetical protein